MLHCRVAAYKGRVKNPAQTPVIELETPSGNRTTQYLHLYTIYNI